MSQFQPAYDFVMKTEDPHRAYANVADNKGRAISGINSLAFPQEFASIAAIPQISRGTAVAAFYQGHFWEPLKVGGLTFQDVANRVMDQAVNGGLDSGAVLLQRAVNACGGTLIVDGQIGSATLEAANATDPDRLLASFRAVRTTFYKAVLQAHPEDAPYRSLWLERAEA